MAETERIRFGQGASPLAVSAYTRGVLTDILNAAGCQSCIVTSTARTPKAQARAMYRNIDETGADTQYGIYGPNGDQVISLCEQMKARKCYGPAQIVEAMTAKIVALGPSNVSHHCIDHRQANVLDIDQHSVATKIISFERALSADKRVSKWLHENRCFHVEIQQPQLNEKDKAA